VKLEALDIIGKKVLIIGETGSGKTRLAAKLLQKLMSILNLEEITVIDLAPERIGCAGGKLRDYIDLTGKVRYFSPLKVYMPRLFGTSRKEVQRYAELNREKMEPLLMEFIKSPTSTLVINDLTLYLHSGRLEVILNCVEKAKTFLATAYYGSKLAEDLGTGISLRERQLTDKLATFMDLVVKID
jgi:serine kinase of HPr protein (carbohydrate metabolism regulator)